ncbi:MULTISPECIES: protein translocase subunit SecD [Cyanophyceae]|uniref:protein translocase subunit SecD n=1 Tax=Cyanophyceae TaxID=3028117 RepID=UPI00016DC5B8|nr:MULTISPECIES: protein translocase subunit SecD [Cyanophyceae]ACA98661.1 protein-export membrane protein SecD [Picosynechococcus sp. PCC 7002]ANV89752.1 protein-export membrane protein SecD [Picosynechococcus sp. PCC 8807]SMH40084.1 preprotein translocase subunit SecD [Picosynechococcus sp. OG1]SMQ78319.1 preprotein translocase subunit SecD [Synechococcus sp. 7002]
MQKQRLIIVAILFLVAIAITILTTLPLQLGLDLKGGAQLTIQVQPNAEGVVVEADDTAAVKRVIENRINGLGVAEPITQLVGNDRILVQLPGVTDPEQAERVLGGTAQLEFRPQNPGTEAEFQEKYALRRQLDAQLTSLRGSASPAASDAEIEELETNIDSLDQEILALFEPVGLVGEYVTNAQPAPTQTGNSWQVFLNFNSEGAELFAEITKGLAGTGRSVGIFLDDALLSAPTVGPEYTAQGIAGGNVTITGNFDIDTASDLAIQIRGGSLPFPVAVVENRTVGATLGQDSIRQSIYAGIAGLILVLIFVAVYYRLPGLIADVALVVYTLLTLACYSLVGVTLTLPGIAGFILSIGMAVDANVLIFERTREEIYKGNTLYRAVESGFFNAFSSILDSNVTTLIACAALFFLGSGLVKGFALTLAIGVGVSMFTAVTCSRTLLLLTVLGLPAVRQNPKLFAPKVPN